MNQKETEAVKKSGPNVSCNGGGNQGSLCYSFQQACDGAGGDCCQRNPRPADTLRHSGVGAGESHLGAGTGGAGGDAPELHRREREDCPRPGGVAEMLQQAGGAIQESQGTVR